MKTAISLPDALFKAADSLANRLGVSRSRLYATALEEYVARHQSRRVSQRLDALYSVESSSLDPALARAQTNLLTEGDW